ncbi:MAG: hypothetical protein Q9226_002254 [Calogaya cf. arnoldii]
MAAKNRPYSLSAKSAGLLEQLLHSYDEPPLADHQSYHETLKHLEHLKRKLDEANYMQHSRDLSSLLENQMRNTNNLTGNVAAAAEYAQYIGQAAAKVAVVIQEIEEMEKGIRHFCNLWYGYHQRLLRRQDMWVHPAWAHPPVTPPPPPQAMGDASPCLSEQM